MSKIQDAADFIERLKALTSRGGRQVNAQKAANSTQLFVRFINLPPGVGGAGGGAEAENNKALFIVTGWEKDSNGPAPAKVKVEAATSVFRTLKLRAKTAAPEVICKYLADHLNQIAEQIPPNFTHTRMAVAVAERYLERKLS